MPDFSNLPFRQQIDHVIRFMKIAWAKQPWNSLPPQINLLISVSVKQKFGASPMLDPYSQAELVAFDGNWILLLKTQWRRPRKATRFTPFPTDPFPPKVSPTDALRFSLQGPPGERSIWPPPGKPSSVLNQNV